MSSEKEMFAFKIWKQNKTKQKNNNNNLTPGNMRRNGKGKPLLKNAFDA